MRQIAIFVAVGCAAALTHLSVVAFLVEKFDANALSANAIGFSIAFTVSFTGHSRWTFPAGGARRSLALFRFFAVALTGFIMNQSAYAAVLHVFGARYYLSILAVVLLGVAVATFLLSKLWAFAQAE
jgi:putative flippase GtrA